MMKSQSKKHRQMLASRRWRAKHPAESSAASERWRKNNLVRVAVRAALRREKWPEESREYVRRCQEKNMAVYRRTARKKYASDPMYRAKVKLWVKVRASRLLRATPRWVRYEDLAAAYQDCDKISENTGVKYHVDHIYPITHKLFCGLNVPWNLKAIPASENLRKGNRVCPAMLYPRVVT